MQESLLNNNPATVQEQKTGGGLSIRQTGCNWQRQAITKPGTLSKIKNQNIETSSRNARAGKLFLHGELTDRVLLNFSAHWMCVCVCVLIGCSCIQLEVCGTRAWDRVISTMRGILGIVVRVICGGVEEQDALTAWSRCCCVECQCIFIFQFICIMNIIAKYVKNTPSLPPRNKNYCIFCKGKGLYSLTLYAVVLWIRVEV